MALIRPIPIKSAEPDIFVLVNRSSSADPYVLVDGNNYKAGSGGTSWSVGDISVDASNVTKGVSITIAANGTYHYKVLSPTGTSILEGDETITTGSHVFDFSNVSGITTNDWCVVLYGTKD
jgi:hypothetical protein